MVESAPVHSRHRPRDALEDRPARVQLDDIETLPKRLGAEGNGKFRALHRITNLAGAKMSPQKAVDALERVAPFLELAEQLRQTQVHLIRAFRPAAQVQEQHKAAKSGPVC